MLHQLVRMAVATLFLLNVVSIDQGYGNSAQLIRLTSAQEDSRFTGATPAPTPLCRPRNVSVPEQLSVAGRGAGQGADDTTTVMEEECKIFDLPCWILIVVFILIFLCCICGTVAAFQLGLHRVKQIEKQRKGMEVYPSSPHLIAPNTSKVLTPGERQHMMDLIRSGSFSGGAFELHSPAFATRQSRHGSCSGSGPRSAKSALQGGFASDGVSPQGESPVLGEDGDADNSTSRPTSMRKPRSQPEKQPWALTEVTSQDMAAVKNSPPTSPKKNDVLKNVKKVNPKSLKIYGRASHDSPDLGAKVPTTALRHKTLKAIKKKSTNGDDEKGLFNQSEAEHTMESTIVMQTTMPFRDRIGSQSASVVNSGNLSVFTEEDRDDNSYSTSVFLGPDQSHSRRHSHSRKRRGSKFNPKSLRGWSGSGTQAPWISPRASCEETSSYLRPYDPRTLRGSRSGSASVSNADSRSCSLSMEAEDENDESHRNDDHSYSNSLFLGADQSTSRRQPQDQSTSRKRRGSKFNPKSLRGWSGSGSRSPWMSDSNMMLSVVSLPEEGNHSSSARMSARASQPKPMTDQRRKSLKCRVVPRKPSTKGEKHDEEFEVVPEDEEMIQFQYGGGMFERQL